MINKVKNTNNRITGLYLVIVFIAISVAAKIVKVQQFSESINTSSQPRYFTVEAPRGNIIADDGALLAISMPLYDVHLDMSVMNKELFQTGVSELSIRLANLFKGKTNAKTNIEYESLLRDSKEAKKNKYILLRYNVTHNELNALKKMPILKLGQNKGGLIAKQRPNREKPFNLLAQRTVGVLRQINPVGIERAFNQTLSGVDGIHLKRKIAKGIWVPQDAEGNRLPIAGDNVLTTINIDMQDVAEKALENTLIKNDADWGCVVLMEVETGKVKVIANLKKQSDGSVRENFNYALAKHVSPGSTFKLASVIAGLEDGFFKVEDSVRTYGGRFTFYDRVMMDSKLGVYDEISIKHAFIKSSNVGISRIISDNYESNPTSFTDRIYKMGLSTPLELELPFPNNLKSPIPNKGGWSGVTLPWMSIGYEMQLTPIHMLTFYNAIANQGKMVKPIFTSAIYRSGEIVERFKTQLINPAICSKSTIEEVIPLLIGVVEEGTAKNIRSNDYLIAGKTGTTVINFNNRAEGEKKEYQASFAGFFPADNPKYSCIVVINNPKENGHYGGSVAAPIFKELADKVYASDMSIHKALQQSDVVLSLPKIKQGNAEDVNNVLVNFDLNRIVTDSMWMVASTTDLKKEIMPDLSGMGLQDAIYLLEKYGLVVEITGIGTVKSQSISKGNKFMKGSVIKLELA